MLKQKSLTLMCIALALGITACGEQSTSKQENETETAQNTEATSQSPVELKQNPDLNTEVAMESIEFEGTIIYKNLEGGFFAIQADDGSKYLPLNLSEDMKKGGHKVRVKATLQPTVRTIFMFGTPIEINEIEVIGTNPSAMDDTI